MVEIEEISTNLHSDRPVVAAADDAALLPVTSPEDAPDPPTNF